MMSWNHNPIRYGRYSHKHCQKESKLSVDFWHGPMWQRSWVRCSIILAPLTSLFEECGHTKVTRANNTKENELWHLDKVHWKAFNDVKAIIWKDVALDYPDYSKKFEKYNDASSKQRSIVITQKTLWNTAALQHDWNWTTGAYLKQ